MMSRQQLHHLSGAYVLGALDPDERRLFEERLPYWDDMRSEVTELADTAVALGLAVPPVQPGPDLRDRVLQLVAQTPQLASEQPPPDVAGRRRPRGVGRGVRTIQRGVRRSSSPRRSGLAVLAAIGAAALALIAAVQFGPALVGVGPAPLTVAQVTGSADARRLPVSLAGARGVELLYSGELSASVLTWDRLPALASGQVYELWYIDGDARPAGLLPPASGGGSMLLDGEWSAGDRVGMTIEPAGGSAQPTTEPLVLLGPLA